MTDFVSNENVETELSLETIRAVAAKVVELHNSRNEGSTVNYKAESLLKRDFFAVAIFPERTVITQARQLREELIEAFVKSNADLLSYSICAIGTWYDAEENMSWLDISVIIADETTARELGDEYNQKAIYDLRLEKIIELTGNGMMPEEKISLSEIERLRLIISEKEK